MKTRTILGMLVLTLLGVLLAGCSSFRPDPNVTMFAGKMGGQYNGGWVQFYAKRLDDHTYAIVVSGDQRLTKAQVLDGWIWMADKLAAGKPYEKQTKIEPSDYDGGMIVNELPATTRYVGTKVTGQIELK